MKLWQKIFIGMFCGLIAGLLFPGQVRYFKVVGELFLTLIHMVILPLVFTSITMGIASIHDPKKLGRVGAKTFFLYFATTMCAVMVGVLFATLLTPGTAIQLGGSDQVQALDTSNSVSTVVASLFPRNPFQSFVEGNVLQVLIFSGFFGISLLLCGEKAAPIQHLIEGLAAVIQKLVSIVVNLSPYGVFAIMAWVVASFGYAALYPMINFLLSYYAACSFHLIFVFGGLLLLVARVNPISFIRGSIDAITMAFSTCSSSATLPVALSCATANLGVSVPLASFMLPLGTSMNMNGAAIFQGMSALFICQAYGIVLAWQSIFTLIFVATFSAIGSAGVPGTGFIMLSAVLSSVGIPIEGLALLAGIDRVREMVSTVLNILGDLVCLVVVDKQEKGIHSKP